MRTAGVRKRHNKGLRAQLGAAAEQDQERKRKECRLKKTVIDTEGELSSQRPQV